MRLQSIIFCMIRMDKTISTINTINRKNCQFCFGFVCTCRSKRQQSIFESSFQWYDLDMIGWREWTFFCRESCGHQPTNKQKSVKRFACTMKHDSLRFEMIDLFISFYYWLLRYNLYGNILCLYLYSYSHYSVYVECFAKQFFLLNEIERDKYNWCFKFVEI